MFRSTVSKYLAIALCSGALAACTTGAETGSSTASKSTTPSFPEATPENLVSQGFTRFIYSAGGKTYAIFRKRDPLVRGEKVGIQVISGPAFTATIADDAEVQNTLRDAYRANKICAEGEHPGVLGIGYGPGIWGGVPTWTASVRCSTKLQSNI